MILLDDIEKFINEHGSSTILKYQLDLTKQEYSSLEKKLSEALGEIARFEVKLEREAGEHLATKSELQTLKTEHEEEKIIHACFEFRRGRRTQNKWLPFCPKCHAPALIDYQHTNATALCSTNCGFEVVFTNHVTIDGLVSQLPK